MYEFLCACVNVSMCVCVYTFLCVCVLVCVYAYLYVVAGHVHLRLCSDFITLPSFDFQCGFNSFVSLYAYIYYIWSIVLLNLSN